MACNFLPTLMFLLYSTHSLCDTNMTDNMRMLNDSSKLNKDLYVVHAVVYQVGIITNKTGSDTGNFNSTGEEEAVTFFHTNGSNVDLSKIPRPLFTNITAETIVGLTPSASTDKSTVNSSTWIKTNQHRHLRSATEYLQISKVPQMEIFKNITNAELFTRYIKRNTDKNESTPVKIAKGSAVIPKEVGIQAISIPPLLSFSNNLSNIPIPIPNTSIVQYAKVNAIVDHASN